MKRILLVDPSSERSIGLSDAFARRRVSVSQAEMALVALAKVERDRPDAVVCAAVQGDMSATEFIAMLKSDSRLDPPTVLVYGSEGDIRAHAEQADFVVHEDDSPVLTADRVLAALNPERTARRFLPAEEGMRDVEGTIALEGTLESFGVAELMVLLGDKGRTGRLAMSLGEAEATLYYLEGRLVHAVAGRERGIAAITRLLGSKSPADETLFRFASLPADVLREVERSVSVDGMELLLQASQHG